MTHVSDSDVHEAATAQLVIDSHLTRASSRTLPSVCRRAGSAQMSETSARGGGRQILFGHHARLPCGEVTEKHVSSALF
ncbi:MAG: hypothetical protein C0449_11430 [Polaromonas sp.]|nr:hypothetical protein [Polaromonas sp.]